MNTLLQLVLYILIQLVLFLLIQLSKQQKQMKCVSIVYRKPKQDNLISQFIPIRTLKRTVDEYYEKLKDKQQYQHKFAIKPDPSVPRSMVNTARTYRAAKTARQIQIISSINIMPIRASCENIFKNYTNPEREQQNKQKKFRSTFVKKKTSTGFYSLKGINMKNNDLFQEQSKFHLRKYDQQNKMHSKLVNLKKLKLVKNTTILISIDFILNENTFWSQDVIDEVCYKNWKTLQQHSNIIWLTKRQNSAKKLQKYANEYGLRLDGVYQILPRKKGQTLTVSLSSFQKDYKYQLQNSSKKQQFKKQLIVMQSIKVDSIKSISYQQFYNSFPICKSMRCVVHFIQIDINDKQRFNSPLKILSKDKLPQPNSINYLFQQFYKDNAIKQSPISRPFTSNQVLQIPDFSYEPNQQQEQQQFTKQQMMLKYDLIKQNFIDYFNHNLKISMNKKLVVGESQYSLQFLIGDMLKRNFNIMYNHHKQCRKIGMKLEGIRQKEKKKHINLGNENDDDLFIKNRSNLEQSYKQKKNIFNIKLKNPQLKSKHNIQEIIKSKLVSNNDHDELIQRKDLISSSSKKGKSTSEDEKKVYYRQPVFLWKK